MEVVLEVHLTVGYFDGVVHEHKRLVREYSIVLTLGRECGMFPKP